MDTIEQVFFDKNLFWESLRTEAANRGVPLHGHFELTPFCNLKCKMCYVQLERTEDVVSKMIGLDDWKKIIDSAVANGMIFASLTGGECLTSPWFKEIYLYLQSKGVMIFVLSNGVLLGEWIDFFKEHPPKLIQISIYGKDEEDYDRVTGYRAYKKVHDNVEKAIEYGLPISINITPSKYLFEIYDIASYYKNKNVSVSLNHHLINPKTNTNRNLEEFNLTLDEKIYVSAKFYEAINGDKPKMKEDDEISHIIEVVESNNILKGLDCAAGRSDFAIGWNGDMYMCVAIDLVTGHPLIEGFEKAWKNTNDIAENFVTPLECKNCNISEVCNKCPAQHYAIKNGVRLNDRVCDETKSNLKNGLEYL